MGIFWNIPGLCINVCDLVSNCIVKALSNHNLGNSLLHAPSTNQNVLSYLQNQYSFDVSESVDVGYELGYINAVDDDDGKDGELEYLLVGDSNDKGFNLDRKSGRLSVDGVLDRESVESIELMALVKNPGPVAGQYLFIQYYLQSLLLFVSFYLNWLMLDGNLS